MVTKGRESSCHFYVYLEPRVFFLCKFLHTCVSLFEKQEDYIINFLIFEKKFASKEIFCINFIRCLFLAIINN